MWFLYPFFAGYYTNITVNSYNTKRISSLEKSLSEKYVHIPGCEKNGAFHIGIQKNRAFHILFVEKRGPVIYLAALKKGAIWHAHPYYAIYRKLPPPPPPPEKRVNGKQCRPRIRDRVNRIYWYQMSAFDSKIVIKALTVLVARLSDADWENGQEQGLTIISFKLLLPVI